MADERKLRKLSQSTIDADTYHVGRFAEFFGQPVEQATPEDVRAFPLPLLEVRKVGWSSFKQAVCGLRFLSRVTFPRPWVVTRIPFGRVALLAGPAEQRRSGTPCLTFEREPALLTSCPAIVALTFPAERSASRW